MEQYHRNLASCYLYQSMEFWEKKNPSLTLPGIHLQGDSKSSQGDNQYKSQTQLHLLMWQYA